MRKLGKVVGTLLLLPFAAFAQSRGTAPPASIFSSGGATPPPASIFSMQPEGGNFGAGAHLGFGAPRFGGTRLGFGVNVPGPRRLHQRAFRGQGQFQGSFPVYIPYVVDSYDDYSGSVLSPSEIENGGTFQSSRRTTMPDNAREAPTIFENRTQSYRYRSGADEAARDEDSRYGTHYLDGRERRPRSQREPDGEQSASTPAQSVQTAAATSSLEDSSPTLLIFRDGHQQEVMNYAIMGNMLFVLSGERAKIPVAEIDVAKTTAANEKRGLEFHVPKS